MDFSSWGGLALICVLVVIGKGCTAGEDSVEPASGVGLGAQELRVEFSADRKAWHCQVNGKSLIFLDNDGDGLTEACQVHQADKWLRKVIFAQREYKGFEVLPEKLEASKVRGMSVVIYERWPLTTKPMRSEPVTTPELLKVVCRMLNELSFTWSGWCVETQDGPDVGASYSSLWVMPSVGIELWLKGQEEPLTITLRHTNNSYELRDESLVASLKGEQWRFGNDGVCRLLSGFPGICAADPSRETDSFAKSLPGRHEHPNFWPPGAYQPPTYYGGVPITWDGKPVETPTHAQKVDQIRSLLKTCSSWLVGEDEQRAPP